MQEQNASEETISNLTQALEREKEQEKEPTEKEKASDAESNTLSPSSTLKTRRRRWFGGKEKERVSSAVSPADAGRSTGSNIPSSDSPASRTPSRPISIQGSRKPSQYSVHEGSGSVATSDSASLREKDAANVSDHHNQWSTRAAGGTERAEREFGLSDEINMGLS